MAEETPFGERTEAPTQKRREDFRKRGQVAQSREVHTAAIFTLLLCFWFFYAPLFFDRLTGLIARLWRGSGLLTLTPNSLAFLFRAVTGELGLLLAPLFLVTLAVGVLGTFVQIGWLFTWQPLQPDFGKLDPVKGFGRFFSKRSLVELVKSLLKVLLVGWVAARTVQGRFAEILLLGMADLPEILRFLAVTAALVLFKVSGVMIFLALIDYGFVRWEMEEKMKMTRQELKEEMRETEGDPHIKSKIRTIQQEMARKRMMAAVPEADVVVTNPTHLAVALRYDRERMAAPMVVAKGRDLVAQRIKEIAREHQVPVIENPPVARLLHNKVEIGGIIPEELFRAVAEILAHVYALKNRRI